MAKSADIINGLFNSMTEPDLISFGGGSPANEALPVDIVRELSQKVFSFESRGVEALQYGKVQGIPELRQIVADTLLPPQGVREPAENIMIVSGGLETMNLLCQVFIEPGDVILVESPSFVHCVEIFEMFQARCIAVECDDQGMVPEALEESIRRFQPKMVYVIPTFQNPCGKTIPAERRKRIAELGSEYDVIILEDDPYRELRYSGEDQPAIKSYDATGHTVLASSFSKIFSPGSRLGYVCAAPEIIAQLVNVKTATNSFTSTISQVLCAEYFKQGYFDDHLAEVREIYRQRRDAMIESIDRYLPAGTKRVYPDGGLFTWVELPGGIDTTELLKEATSEIKVAFIAGEGFFVEKDGRGRNCMRMSFGNVTPENIRIGMRRLGELVAKKLAEKKD